jgi:hypothetical protein
MNRDAIWYITLTIVLCSVCLLVGAIAVTDRIQLSNIEVACIRAHGEMRDGVCSFGGER